MLKLLIYLTIIGSGAGAGFLMARSYDNRIFHLQDLITLLKILEAEMKYRQDPLPVLLSKIGELSSSLAGKFFLRVCHGLKEHYSFDFYGAWAWAVSDVYSDTALLEKDKEILSEVGIELGKTDLENQQSLFVRVFSRLEQQIAEAEEEKRTKGKVYRSLGTAIGILVVIVLL